MIEAGSMQQSKAPIASKAGCLGVNSLGQAMRYNYGKGFPPCACQLMMVLLSPEHCLPAASQGQNTQVVIDAAACWPQESSLHAV